MNPKSSNSKLHLIGTAIFVFLIPFLVALVSSADSQTEEVATPSTVSQVSR